MDFSTTHMAYTLHTQDSRRAEQERERLRVIRERAAERGVGVVEAPVVSHRAGIFAVLATLRSRRTAAL